MKNVALIACCSALLSLTACKRIESDVDGTIAQPRELKDYALNTVAGVGVAIADMNWDGWPDIVTSVPGSGIHYFENDRHGAFFDRGIIVPDRARNSQSGIGIAAADIDGDGTIDLVIATPGVGVQIVRNPVPKKFQ